MGTRSLVGAETESGVKMVYVHWDGYPEGRIPILRELVKRDGLSRVVSTLLQTPSGWSHLTEHPELSAGMTDGRFEVVPGYGVRYTMTEIPGYGVQGDPEYHTPENWDADSWCEYVYVITPDGRLKWAEYGPSYGDLQWHEVELVETVDKP